MRKIHEMLRLKYEVGLSHRLIGQSLGVSPATVSDYLLRVRAAGLSWPLPEAVDEAELERRLYAEEPSKSGRVRPLPDWSLVHQELRGKGVTLALLWQEYKAAHPDGYQYSRYCECYERWGGQLELAMRQTHKVGEKLFIDCAGQTVEVVERQTGEVREAQVFVAVLGASNYTFAEATWTQKLPDFIASHVRAFEFFEGVTELLIPDNLKSGVRSPDRYEAEINPSYQEMATHYGKVVLPARVRRPKDKAKVEVGVQIVERWVLAKLRHQTFFTLAELNTELSRLLLELNAHPFQKLPGTRRDAFERLDRPALRPLPSQRYVLAEWKKARVGIDYHIEVEGHYYSVPHQLVSKPVDVQYTSTTIECLFRGERVASHPRSFSRGTSHHGGRAHAAQPSGIRGVDPTATGGLGGRLRPVGGVDGRSDPRA